MRPLSTRLGTRPTGAARRWAELRGRLAGVLRRQPEPFVVALVGATALFTATVPLFRGWFDLYVYYGAVHAWVWDGGQLYDFALPGTRYGFTYPPFTAVCMLPLAVMSRPVAVCAALALNVAASVVVLRTLPGRWPAGPGTPSWAVCSCCWSRCATPSASAR